MLHSAHLFAMTNMTQSHYPSELQTTQAWLSHTAPGRNVLTDVKGLKQTELLLTLNKATNAKPEEVAAILDRILSGVTATEENE